MTAKQNKDLFRKFINEVINKKNFDLLEEYCSEDFTLDGGSMGTIHGMDEFRKVNTESGGGKTFPDFKATIEDIVAEGDRVTVRYIMNATHEGMFMEVPPTGKKIKWNATVIYKIVNNKISEGWLCEDILGLMKQIGVKQIPQQQNK